MKSFTCFLLLSLMTFNGVALAKDPELSPVYQPPAEQVSGNISIWGHGALGGRFDFSEAVVKE
jgi:hypothetical protein